MVVVVLMDLLLLVVLLTSPNMVTPQVHLGVILVVTMEVDQAVPVVLQAAVVLVVVIRRFCG